MSNEMLAPEHLTEASAAWWRSVVRDFELEPHHVRLLTLAAEAWDRAEQARAIVSREGLTYTDRFGAPHPRPEVAIEHGARLAFARLLRELALDDLPEPDTRVPRIGGRR